MKFSVKKVWDIFSNTHTLKDMFSNFIFSGNSNSSDRDKGLKAHPKGKGQIDERLFFTACAMAEKKLCKKHKFSTSDAQRRIHNVIKVVNEFKPKKRAKIILTIGLEQSTHKKTTERPDGPIVREYYRNTSGRDIILMMALHDDRNFTRSCCKAMITSAEKLEDDIADAFAVAEAITKGIAKGHKKSAIANEHLFWEPWWTPFVPFRSKLVKILKARHDARINS